MRRFALTLLLCGLPSMAAAQPSEKKPDAETAAPIPQYSLNEAVNDPQKRAALIEELFKRLKSSPSEEDAQRVATAIDALLAQTGNAAADLFMQWGEESVKTGDLARGMDYFDGAALLTPNAPEPYHKRAIVYYAQDDYARALADLQRAYALEPRHIGVLTGLAAVFADLNRDKESLHAYERALALNPHLEDAQKLTDGLRRKVEGDRI